MHRVGGVSITVAMLVRVGGALLLFRSSKRPLPSDDGGRGYQDGSLAEGQAMQNRNDGIESQ